MKVIGITGGIATGKSTASRYLAELGYTVIDADEVAKGLQSPGGIALKKIENIFGSDVLHKDGSLNRVALGELVFCNDQAREQLNNIMLPLIRTAFVTRIAKSQEEIIFLDVPLLFEAKFDELTTENLVISASQQMQLKRLMDRNDLSQADAKLRIEAQMQLSEKVARADYVIENDGSIIELIKQIENFLEVINNV